jgi:MYXO-CTERM domain-containing protein
MVEMAEKTARRRSASVVAMLCGAVCLLTVPAFGEVMQSGGGIIPVLRVGQTKCDTVDQSGQGWGNVQVCLDNNEVALGGKVGDIDAIKDATVDQETFNPNCQLKFTVVQRGGGYLSVFGWYEAKGGNVPPALADMHVFLGCDDKPGTSKVLMVPSGVQKIGFFMANDGYTCVPQAADGTLAAEPTNSFYSERRFNGKLRNGDPEPGLNQDQIRVLMWQSVAVPESFYFGWEDTKFGADDDFDDLLTQVSGVECSSGGQACDTGKIGLCAKGAMQCQKGGLACVEIEQPSAETCNAVDDDCNGMIDDGPNLCPAGQVCYRGSCLPNCTRGEFPCEPNFVCDPKQGVCVEDSCENKTCDAGQVCRSGACIGECVGVKCPYGQACRQGGCVDVCAGMTCDDGFACAVGFPSGPDQEPVGFCSSCGCRGCDTGLTCVSNVCVPDVCAKVTCSAGTHCDAGTCVDDCMGATCPPGQLCAMGSCTVDPNAPDGGVDAGVGGAVLIPPMLTSGTGGQPSSSSGGTSAPTQPIDSGHYTPKSPGCACRTAGPSRTGAALAFGSLLGLVALLGVRRRRRV